MADQGEGSMESAGRSPPPGFARRGGPRWRGRPVAPAPAPARGHRLRHAAPEEGHGSTEEERAAAERRAAEERRWRYEKLYQKYMLLYCCLASEEERVAMEDPNGWRPPIPSNVSSEEQIRVMEAQKQKKKLQEENSLLLMKLKEVELELEMRKAENKKMQKKHRQELRSRDWRECVMLCLFFVCLVLAAMISVR